MQATGIPGEGAAVPAIPDRSPTRQAPLSTVLRWAGGRLPHRGVLIALVVGVAFAGVDGIRSFSDAQGTVAVMADLAAVELSPLTAAAPRPDSDIPSDFATMVVAPDGTVLASNYDAVPEGALFEDERMPEDALWSSASLGQGFGEAVVALPVASVTLSVFGRTVALTVIAAIALTLLTRSPVPVAPAVPQADRAPARAAEQEWLDDVPYGVARWDGDGRLMSANRTFFRLLRLDADTVPEGSVYSTVSRRIAGRISARPVLDQSRQRVVDVEREDGSAIMLDERGCPDGGFISTVTDVTERRIADKMLSNIREEQRLLARRYHEEKIRAEAASRAKTTFLAHLSHDIRTPLNHIIGFADLMQLETYGPLGDRRYTDYLSDIRNSGERLLSAFAQILEYAELEGGRKALKSEPVAIETLMRTAAARYREAARGRGVHLNLTSIAAVTVAADRHCLERMLDNLLDNAIRFTPRGGEVRIASWTGPSGVVLEVADTGVGIPEDQLERLTQPFALTDASFTKTSVGVGLGLAIARTIAELSGGRLAIDSVASVGTTVAVSLPIVDEESAPDTVVARAA